nr:Mor transcription activator family protein [uncultured Romboutsia sp.]
MLEFLTESDVPDSVKDVVAFKDLVKLAGGSNLYIPNESNLVKPIRNRMIRDEFKGSYKDISMKYGISEIQVRNIINK